LYLYVISSCSALMSQLIFKISLYFNSIADDGGGMDPDKMRQCMSLGYSAKSKIANTIGQCKPLVLEACTNMFIGCVFQLYRSINFLYIWFIRWKWV
jgi:hypothetical protein